MGDSSGNQPERRKNKKRKSVLSNAKKYGKQGRYGRGTDISEVSYQYFVKVLETHKAGFPSKDEEIMFANNVLQETHNDVINFSCNQIGCRVIELLLPVANYETISTFTNAFSENLRQYLSDPYASHVIQALFRVCYQRSLTETDEEIKENCKKYALKISKFLLNNLEDFINDMCANHIIREVLLTFAGIPKENVNKKLEEQKIKTEEISEEYTEIVQEYTKRLKSWPHFKNLPYSDLSSGLLQNLLVALKNTDMKLLKKVVKKLIDESFSTATGSENDENKLKDVFTSTPATILLETAISVATPKLFTQIYANCFIQNLSALAKNKQSNLAVQKLLNCCTEKTEFEAMFDELSDHFETIISCGYTGVISAIAQACKRLSAKQGHFVQSLMKALHCIEPQERQNHFVATVTRLISYERIDEAQKEKYFVNLHGSLVLQTMLEFNKPIKIVTSILSMEPNDLKTLFSDVKGSHVMDSYMSSPYIGEKNREKLIWRMQGTYQELAASKHGSRSLDAIWTAASLKLRMKIMEELSYKEGLWSNTPTGIIIANKFNLHVYMRSVDEWKQIQGKTDKTKQMFADITGEKV